MVKKDTTDVIPVPAPQVKTNAANSIPIIALVLGVVSLVTFMWFLGVVAIVLGVIGLRRYEENRGFSIAGLVTGIISTLLMIGAAIFIIVIIVVAATSSDSMPSPQERTRSYDSQYDRDSSDRYYRGLRDGI